MKTYAERMGMIAIMLVFKGIPFSYRKLHDGFQILFPWFTDGDIACHSGTSGSKHGYVETYGFTWDEGDISVLTAEEAIEKVCGLYELLT